MGFNSGKIKVQSSAKKKTNPFGKDVIVDPMGQWKYPGQVTKVPSGNITMSGVPYPVYGMDELGNGQMMYPGMDYVFPGNMVTEIPMAQIGGELELDEDQVEQYRRNGFVVEELPKAQMGKEQEAAYEQYKSNVQNNYKSMLGTKFRPDISKMPEAKDMNPGEYNCIGGACNFQKVMGADMPQIPGNSNFWEKAQAGTIPVKVYATSETDDYKSTWDYIQPGDFIGHDIGPGGGKNEYYPEHTNVFIRWDKNPHTGKKIAVTIDANTGVDHSYAERNYNYEDLINPQGKKFFVGRPTKVNGVNLDFKVPQTDYRSYFPKVSEETLSGLKPLKWETNKEYKNFSDLNKDQINNLKVIKETLTNKKRDFIQATGMPEDLYDQLASRIPGIAYQESKLGKTDPSQSIFQVEKNLLSGDFIDAARTYAEGMGQELKSLTGGWSSKGLMQVKEDVLFNAPETRIALKKLGITKDNYDPSNKEHNIIASMILFDNINKTNVKNFDKVKGNNPNLDLADKVLYYYSNNNIPKSGQAIGNSEYINNVKNFSPIKLRSDQYAVTRQFGGELELTDEEVEEYRRGGYVVEELPQAQVGYNTPEYNQAYQQGQVTRYNPQTDIYQAQDLPAFEMTGKDTRIADAVRRGRDQFAQDYIVPAAKMAAGFTPLGPLVGLTDAAYALSQGDTFGGVLGAGLEALPYGIGKGAKALSKFKNIGRTANTEPNIIRHVLEDPNKKTTLKKIEDKLTAAKIFPSLNIKHLPKNISFENNMYSVIARGPKGERVAYLDLHPESYITGYKKPNGTFLQKNDVIDRMINDPEYYKQWRDRLVTIKEKGDWLKPAMIKVNKNLWGNQMQDVLYQKGIELAKSQGFKGIRSGDTLLSPSKTKKAHERFMGEALGENMTSGVRHQIKGLTGHINPNVEKEFLDRYAKLNKFQINPGLKNFNELSDLQRLGVIGTGMLPAGWYGANKMMEGASYLINKLDENEQTSSLSNKQFGGTYDILELSDEEAKELKRRGYIIENV